MVPSYVEAHVGCARRREHLDAEAESGAMGQPRDGLSHVDAIPLHLSMRIRSVADDTCYLWLRWCHRSLWMVSAYIRCLPQHTARLDLSDRLQACCSNGPCERAIALISR